MISTHDIRKVLTNIIPKYPNVKKKLNISLVNNFKNILDVRKLTVGCVLCSLHCGNKKHETGYKKQRTGNKKQAQTAGNRKQETDNRKQTTGNKARTLEKNKSWLDKFW